MERKIQFQDSYNGFLSSQYCITINTEVEANEIFFSSVENNLSMLNDVPGNHETVYEVEVRREIPEINDCMVKLKRYDLALLDRFQRNRLPEQEHQLRSIKQKRQCYECDLCGYESRLKFLIKSHMQSVHAISSSTDMEKLSHTRYVKPIKDIGIVMKPNHKKLKLKCDKCGFICCIKSKMRLHIESSHAPKDAYKCTHCNFKTNRHKTMKNHVKRHNRVHSETICYECGKSISSIKLLEVHMKSHELEISSDLICKVCGIQFLYESSIIVHTLKFHKDEKEKYHQHNCSQCPKAFRHKYSLKYHLKSFHKKTIRCRDGNCGKKFRLQMHMEDHYQSVHENHHIKKKHTRKSINSIFDQCDVCGMRFKSKNDFKVHMKIQIH